MTDFKVWYCQANKATGDPVIVKNMKTGKVSSRKSFTMKNVDVKMVFKNADSQAKRSGATTVLEITRREL